MKRASFRLGLGTLLLAALAGGVQAQDDPSQQFVDSPEVYLDSSPPVRGYEINATLLYLKPGSQNLEYGTLVSPLPAPTPHWTNQSVNPDFSPAFNVGVRYFLNDVGNDIQVNWTHLDTSDSAHTIGRPNQFAGPPYEIGPDANLYTVMDATANFSYDAINLDVGQVLSNGGPLQVRIFGGLQFARINQTVDASFRSYNGTYQTAYTNDSLFNGIGPRLGMKTQLRLGNFSLLGEMAGAALIGNMHSSFDFASISPDLANLAQPNRQSLTSPDAAQVIPSLDTKIGAAYIFPVGNVGQVRVEGGYQAAVYVNAISDYEITEVVTPSNIQSVGVFLRTADHVQTNFFAHGPYFQAAWEF